MKSVIASHRSARQTHGPAPQTYRPAKRHTLTAIAIATLAAALTGNLASATTVRGGVNQAVVHYSDLDLSCPEDARRLYGRIRIAARDVCQNFRGPDLQRLRVYKQCRAKAVADAVAQVRSPQLAAIAGLDIQHLSKQ